MKRIGMLGGCVVLLLFAWRLIDTDRLFADVYYAKVPSLDVAVQSETYTYDVIAYDEDGRKRPLTFAAPGRLNEGDFLKLYVKDEERVTSYQSVVEREVPLQLKNEQTEEPLSIPLP